MGNIGVLLEWRRRCSRSGRVFTAVQISSFTVRRAIKFDFPPTYITDCKAVVSRHIGP